MSLSDGVGQEHESFGMISLSRVSSNQPVTLFGSSIKHNNFIIMRISTADVNRDLYRNWYHAKDRIVEIEMSYSQFAEAITSLNTEGVPVTIKSVLGKRAEPCPHESQREVFEKEFSQKIKDTFSAITSLQKEANEILNKKTALNKNEKDKLKGLIDSIRTQVTSNMPFVQSQFNKAMDKTTLEAKAEIDAFMTHQIVSLGMEKLAENKQKLLEKGEE